MKSFKKILLSFIILASLIIIMSLSLKKTEAMSDKSYSVPYNTYTLGSNNKLVKTQTAFEPVGLMNFSLYDSETDSSEAIPLFGAQDIYLRNNSLYIANKTNVIVSDKQGNVLRFIRRIEVDGEKINLAEATGVFADDDYIYIADKKNGAVYKVDEDDKAVMVLTKPSSEIYGKDTPFAPTKVVVQPSGSFYIVSEGTKTGVIEMNYAGEFIGFLGINTVSRSFETIMYNFFFGKEGIAKSNPPSPLNIALGEKSSILTINTVSAEETIKRLNIDGINTFSEDTYYPQVTLSDITMSKDNYIYAVSKTGDIFEYDRSGSLLFTFSTLDKAQTKALGLSSAPSGIVVDDSNNLYVLDSEYNTVIIYQKTVFLTLVHRAVSLHNEGRYEESKPVWEEIIRQNTSFALAHSALGMALYKEGNFNDALEEFKTAKDYEGYSNAFWEIRNIYIQNNSLLIFGLLFLLIIFLLFNSTLKKKTSFYVPLIKLKEKLEEKKLIRESFYAFHIIKKPADTYYGIKREKRGSYLSAIILLVVFLLVYTINYYFQGFLFKPDVTSQGAIMNILTVLGILLLYIVSNYFISTLNDGEGRFKDIFISTIYSLMPFIILTLPMTLLSHVLTFNENVIVQIFNFIVYGWCLVLIFMSISEIHNYGFFQTIKCILLTLFAMLIIVLFVLLIYTFISQLFDFLLSIIKEVSYRE